MNDRPVHKKTIQKILAGALICVCLGRAYQCIFWDIPIRSLIWNEDVFAGIVNSLFSLSWDEYLNISNTTGIINSTVSAIGWSLVIGLLVIFLSSKTRPFAVSWVTIMLVFIAFLYHLEKFKTAGQFFEYALQFMTPILFLLFLKEGQSKRWILLAKVCVALTFTSHGLYALGFYPVPGNFVSMTINILPVSNDTAILLLKVAGIVDIIVSVGIFFKGRIFLWSIWYCIVWGVLTALARILANIDMTWLLPSLHQWAYETIYRAPHFLVPIALYMAYRNDRAARVIES